MKEVSFGRSVQTFDYKLGPTHDVIFIFHYPTVDI